MYTLCLVPQTKLIRVRHFQNLKSRRFHSVMRVLSTSIYIVYVEYSVPGRGQKILETVKTL